MNLDMCASFVANPEGKLPDRKARREARSQPAKKRRPVKTQSQKQEIREAFLAGIKAAWIRGGARECSRCPNTFANEQAAHAGLDLHHNAKRSQGQGYRGGTSFGVDDPENLELVCRRCHRELESNPEWSEVAS